ncbi:MAG: hypothetical protein R2824_28970 [Saprospiraceae bacterium]|nr:hypothetical protein [Lewinella sp.]
MRFSILLLLLVSNSLLAQLPNQYHILSEIDTDEDAEHVEVVFGDGEKKKYRNRIISREKKGETLKLVIAVKSDCIGPLFSEASMEADTLFLKFDVRPEIIDGYERVEIGEVIKLRTVELLISGIQKDPNIIYLNEEQIELSSEPYLTFPENFEIDQGDTINRTDRYGQKQGLWVEEYGPLNITESFFKDSKLLHASMFEFYASGALESESFFADTFKIDQAYHKRYDESGNLIEESLAINQTGVFKRKWHANGIKAQENFYDGKLITISQFDEQGRLSCTCETEIGVMELRGYCVLRYGGTGEYVIPCTLYDKNGDKMGKKNKTFAMYYDILPRN